MRTKRITRTRYYCDFCEASGLLKGFWTKPRAVKHERGCTANPNRVCGLCESAIPPKQQKPIAELVACLGLDKDEYGMKELRELCDNCPACILAAIRQSEIQRYNSEQKRGDEDFIDWGIHLAFDFKAEYQAFWNATNEARESTEIHF